MVSIISQLILNGIIAGSIYALVASGFSLMYRVNKFMNFAHGAIVIFAAYFTFFFADMMGLDFFVSAAITIALSALLGYLMNIAVYKQLRKRKASNAVMLIASLALLIFFNALILALFGSDVKSYDFSGNNPIYDLGFIRITGVQIAIIITSLLFLLFLAILIKKTRLGKAMRAISDNKDVSQTIGIDPERVYSKTFLIASATAGIAGVLIGLEQNLNNQLGTSSIISGFTGAVIGGANSVPGAVLGSMLLGLVENLGIWYLPSGYKSAIAFGLLFVFLLFRPQGILGKVVDRT